MSRSDVPIRAFGHAIRIDLSQTPPEVPAEIARLWARCADPRPPQDAETITVRYVPPTEVTARGQVTQDGATVVEYARVEDLPYELSRTVTLTALRAVAGRHVLLHAAGLHDEATDRFLALVAPTGTGKTTACRVLGRSFGYVTDETVCLTDDGTAVPYPKPLSVVRDPQRPFDKDEHSPDELGLGPTPAAPRLGALVVLRRDPSIERPRLVPLGVLEAVAAVIPESSGARVTHHALRRLAEIVTTGPGPHRLEYRDIADCVELLRAHLRTAGAPPPDARPWEHVPPVGSQDEGLSTDVDAAPGPVRTVDPDPGPVPPPEVPVTRAPYVDALTADGQALVLQQDRVVHLHGLAALAWFLLGDPMDRCALATEIRTDLGNHPDADALVAAAVAELWSAGLLTTAARR